MKLMYGLAGLAAAAFAAGCSPADDSASENATARGGGLPDGFRTYDAEAFFMTTSYGMASSAGFAFSPDGSSILISSDETGRFNAYALPIDGGAAEALTDSEVDTVFAVTFFPNDGRILYTADQGGNEINHIYVRAEDGAVTDLTPGEEEKAAFLGWSEDGRSFYLTSNVRDARFFDVYRYDADDYDREMVYQNDEGYQIAAITRDGRYVAASKPRTSADSDVYLVDLEEGETIHVTPHEGNVAHGVYAFTPDGTRLVYATNEYGEFNQAWTYDIASGDRSPLIEADWDVSFVSFSPSGRYRVSGVNADARTELTIIDTSNGAALRLPDMPRGDLGNIRFSRDEAKIAAMLARDTSPNNVVVIDLAEDSARVLTDAMNPEIDESHLVEAEIVRYPSFDGLEIPGPLWRPHQASADNPAPALVWVHGGPGGQTRANYRAAIQHLVNHGYVVLGANNRGSSGYGKTFFHMDDKRHGEVDLQDIVYAKHWLAEQDWVDGERIGVIGGSYGGYMVGAALAFEPDVFDVGINIFGVMNWVRTLQSIPPWWESFREALYDEMGDPATDAERHRRISPLFHAENIRVPLLVVQGANDPRVLQVESDEIVAAVRANGVPVEYIVFPNEGHGFTKRENRITASNAYVDFLDRYLRGGGAAAQD